MDDGIRYAHNGNVRLAFETFGDTASGEPLLLVMGLDFQMVWWPEEFIERLVDVGFAVVRFDNRDTGLYTHFDRVERPNPWKALLGRVPPAYTARNMLDDAVAVMDAVHWSSAHVLGGSMGAGIAQALAMENPGTRAWGTPSRESCSGRWSRRSSASPRPDAVTDTTD